MRRVVFKHPKQKENLLNNYSTKSKSKSECDDCFPTTREYATEFWFWFWFAFVWSFLQTQKNKGLFVTHPYIWKGEVECLCFHQDDRQMWSIVDFIWAPGFVLFWSYGVKYLQCQGYFLKRSFAACKVEQMQREVAWWHLLLRRMCFADHLSSMPKWTSTDQCNIHWMQVMSYITSVVWVFQILKEPSILGVWKKIRTKETLIFFVISKI